MGKNNPTKKNTDKIKQLLKTFEGKDYFEDSVFLKLLKNIPDEEIKKIREVMNIISLKAESKNIVDSSDLTMKYIPMFSYEIVVPYNHFPSMIEPHEINNLVNKLANEFFVIIKPHSTSDSISVRFPIRGNTGFKNLKRILDLKYSQIITSEEKNKEQSEMLDMIISKKNGVEIKNYNGKCSYPVSGKRFEIIKFLKDSSKPGKVLADAQKRNLKAIIKEIGEINRLFKKETAIKDKLIVPVPTGGYELNHKKFNITFLD